MKINEIFYSLQGEGRFTGTPAVFVRFSKCNLKCPFCDTDFEENTEMTEDEVVQQVCGFPSPFVVLTGGEPCLQITQSFLAKLRARRKFIQVETNGTVDVPVRTLVMVNWVTCSPKFEHNAGAALKITHIDELKVIKTEDNDPSVFNDIVKKYFCRVAYLQPCDTGNAERNAEIVRQCVEFVKENPKWRLSLQTQKILNVR